MNSLLTLLEDIATLLDDVAGFTKVATRKTAGVLGDDLALNAEQVSGVDPKRELPVVWAVAKGSALNKLILVPAALAISALAPWAITPLLMLGGAFLCYEGFHKVAEKLFGLGHDDAEARHAELVEAVNDPAVDMVAFEKAKVKGAIRTDFILSAEILVIALGTLEAATFSQRVGTLVTVAVIMTVGVYGIVAGIVKLDDAGLALRRRAGRVSRAIGGAILKGAPWLMKGLGVAGTVAMFLVGGGIFTHGIPGLYPWIEQLAEHAGPVGFAVGILADGLTGVLVGAVVAGVVGIVQRVRRRGAASRPREPGDGV